MSQRFYVRFDLANGWHILDSDCPGIVVDDFGSYKDAADEFADLLNKMSREYFVQ